MKFVSDAPRVDFVRSALESHCLRPIVDVTYSTANLVAMFDRASAATISAASHFGMICCIPHPLSASSIHTNAMTIEHVVEQQAVDAHSFGSHVSDLI